MRKRSLLILALLPGIHLALRLGFGWYNESLLAELPAHEILWAFIRGLQQDVVSLLLVNLPVIMLLMIIAWLPPSRFRHISFLLAKGWFILGNIGAIALNCIDIAYYRFGRHRANLDLNFVLADSLPSLRSVILGYWYLLLLFPGLCYIIIRLARWLPQKTFSPGLYLFFRQILIVVCILFTVGLIGGGRPVMPSTPLLSVSPAALPLAQNSLLTYTYSWFHRSRELQPVNYFPEAEARRLAPSFHQLVSSRPDTTKKNVVLFILESFSRAYVMPGDPHKANTPFLDSLLKKSLFFTHAFANGFTSNQGIVAILGGIPALMDEPFFYSEYANTPLYSLGNILRGEGYNTNFFMGAGKDHFGFGTFAHMTGIDHTYWQDDFNDDRFYDGNWGIFDEPFLQYGARILSEKPPPFYSAFFTISAHPPFTVPADLRPRFVIPGKTPAQQAIAYTDYALQQFFATSKDKPWFHNTLFVFCADHWLDWDNGHVPFSPVNVCTIPIFIYDPAHDSADWRPTIAGQVDLAPTVLDCLGYKGRYTGFGKSLLDPTVADSGRFVINRFGDTYQIIDKEYILGFDLQQNKSCFLYRYSADSACRNDLLRTGDGGPDRKRLETLLRANIQNYRAALARRSLFPF